MIGPAARPAMPALITALREANAEGGPREWSVVDHNTGSWTYDSREEIFWALNQFDADLQDLVPDAIAMTRSSNEMVRIQAVSALRHVVLKGADGPPKHMAAAALEEALQDNSEMVRDIAVEALKNMRGEEAGK